MEDYDRIEVKREGFVLTVGMIESYLQFMKSRGCSKSTYSSYQRSLRDFYAWLPEGKIVQERMAWDYQKALTLRYKPRSVNIKMVSVNGLLEFTRHRDFQVTAQIPVDAEEEKPELSRNEYLRLLSSAKRKRNLRLYLLIKVFATTGIAVNDIPSVTVESVREGKIMTSSNRNRRELRISPCVQSELLQYASDNHIQAGQLFITRNGKPINRSAIFAMIQQIAGDAKVDEKKANPRCLQKLYEKTQEELRANVAMMLQIAYDNLLEGEQGAYGWGEENP